MNFPQLCWRDRLSGLYILVAVFSLSGQVHCEDDSQSNEPPLFEITTRKDADRVHVLRDRNKITFTITSHSGIGGATIRRTTDDWPASPMIRVNLAGLESLSVSNGEVKLHISVLSHSGNARLLHLWKKGKEGPQLDQNSPYWTEVGMFNADGKPTEQLPNKGGYFELVLPNAILKDNPEALHLEWIDFYRG